MKKFHHLFFLSWLLFPLTLKASFIESTMGTAVVNDATAVYYNPAALALLKNPQIIGLNSIGHFHTEFSGQFTQPLFNFTQSGDSLIQSHYNLPSLYFAVPMTDKLTVGFAVISNFFNKDIEGGSLLRYAQSNNEIENMDYVPAIEFKLNKVFSVGVGMNFSYAKFTSDPITGFPSLNIPDNESHNECDGTGIGGDIGLLFRPNATTTIGFNCRSSITYRLKGKSVLEGDPGIASDRYGFTIWTPARNVLSINQMLTPALGVIGTVQRIHWSIFNEMNITGIATQILSRPVILDARVPYHYHDTWLVTLGSHYRITPKWIIRVASSYNESPGNGKYQVSNGDSIILGATMGYEINKYITIDGGYAHAFILNEDIHIQNTRSKIDGATKGFVDAYSLKVVFNI